MHENDEILLKEFWRLTGFHSIASGFVLLECEKKGVVDFAPYSQTLEEHVLVAPCVQSHTLSGFSYFDVIL